MMKLNIELVPRTSWYSNLREILTATEWNKCKKYSKLESNDKCIICGGVGRKWKTECHEEWEYIEETQTQKLKSIQALCPSCHSVKHIGFSISQNKYKSTLYHYKKINKISSEQAEIEITNAFKLWTKRSLKEWNLDISLLLTLENLEIKNLSLRTIEKLERKGKKNLY